MNRQSQVERLAVIDFDGTLVQGDSILHWLKRERLWRYPSVLWWGGLLALARQILSPKSQLPWRSKFKRALLERIQTLPESSWQIQVAEFRSRLFPSVLRHIHTQNFSRLVVASASLQPFIEDVLDGVLPPHSVVACNWPVPGEPFTTCWGREKVRRLRALGILPHQHMVLYTDSPDDSPLMAEASGGIVMVRNSHLTESFTLKSAIPDPVPGN